MALFKLNIKSGERKIVYKPFSISLKYLIDEKKLGDSLKSIEKVFNIRLSELQKKNFLSRNSAEISISKYDSKPDEVILAKVKIDEKFSTDYFRNHLAGFPGRLEKEEAKNIHIFIPKYIPFKSFFNDEEYFYQSFIEGIILGNYSFTDYKSQSKDLRELNIFFYSEDEKKLRNALQKAIIIKDAVYFTRDLANEPASSLTPQVLSGRIKTALSRPGIKVKIFGEKEIKQMKMGGLLAVGKGSENPPRFLIIEYSGAAGKKKKKRRIALVGKGITFDSGGISIKPAKEMGLMKGDMSGAAVVAGIILAASKAKLPVDILGVIPAAENMLSGSAFRPGDIITTYSGKTIEVDNTDAEGRVILADALAYASEKKPDLIIDLATLTGACVVALGEFAGGLFTEYDKAAEELYNAGIKTWERVWRLPVWDDYNILNKSEVADVSNSGGRWGGAISAAKFLQNFVDKNIPWVHLDIAGPALPHELNNYTGKYMTGFGVRLLFEYMAKS